MEYNSQKEKLVISEYGRNVQNLIRHAKTIEDKEKRQAYIEHIVNLMYQMNPHNKNTADLKEKLWKHVFRIAGYDLDVDTPDNVEIVPPDKQKKIERLAYPQKDPKFKHYGHNVEALIEKALQEEDEEKRNEFLAVIGSYLKLAYKTWNQEHYVSDDIIREDLKALTEGKVKIDNNISLDFLKASSSSGGGGKSRRKSHSHKGRNNKRRGRR